jgi:hypothetical protein
MEIVSKFDFFEEKKLNALLESHSIVQDHWSIENRLHWGLDMHIVNPSLYCVGITKLGVLMVAFDFWPAPRRFDSHEQVHELQRLLREL